MKCFWKAHCVGDIEGGIALLKLARLYERTNEADQAAAAYTQYIQVGWWVTSREVSPC
jgi:anaphase-promoting complex subunit 8